jgi:hypothetical protein
VVTKEAGEQEVTRSRLADGEIQRHRGERFSVVNNEEVSKSIVLDPDLGSAKELPPGSGSA